MKRNFSLLAAILTVLIMFTSCCTSMIIKKSLINTRWVGIQQMFVADAGTQTETYTLHFTSDKECTWTDQWYLPSHPATYVNPDGSIDRIPARSSEHVKKGAWTFDKGTVTVTFEDGTSREFQFKDGKLITDSYGDVLILDKQTGD